MTAETIIENARPNNPGKRFAVSRSGDVIGVWEDSEERFLPIAGKTILGDWSYMVRLLVNGQPLVSEWNEV